MEKTKIGTPIREYVAADFDIDGKEECDIIMKGGIASGIVYPYAILEIATKKRFCSLGGTSAGAIASALTAAAEYSRSHRNDPKGFLRLQHYCDQLPDLLPTLFQPDPEFNAAANAVKRLIKFKSVKQFIKSECIRALIFAAIAGVFAALIAGLALGGPAAIILAGIVGAMIGLIVSPTFNVVFPIILPVQKALKALPDRQFGFCSGLTQDGHQDAGLTNWLYDAIQDVAFGEDASAAGPLTFGHLENPDSGKKPIELRMVATNLSMRRPHTLPRFGVSSGFMPEIWSKFFPKPVMEHLVSKSIPFETSADIDLEYKDCRLFPKEADVPVIVAVRMSLSFPVLFKAVPMLMEDFEHERIVKDLGGDTNRKVRQVWISDGGISSNFPIHMFDSVLPSRPTFAFSLDELDWDPADLAGRILLPEDASGGLGVQIQPVASLGAFLFQIVNSAKDWQDQLLSEMTGQRERTARIYLTGDEGGLNLNMKPEISRKLMRYGLDAGRQFVDGTYSFDEHKWRRTIVLYKHLSELFEQADGVWHQDFHAWYTSYMRDVQSYKGLGIGNREQIETGLDAVIKSGRTAMAASNIKNPEDKFPRRRGSLKVGPKY